MDTAYSTTIETTGGIEPLSWSISLGALPNGLDINSGTGEISGTPTESGNFDFTVHVEDGLTRTATKDLSITVAEWVVRYNGPGNEAEQVTGFAVDSAGNTYVTGYSRGNGTSLDYATAKYDTNGNEMWVARYDAGQNLDDLAYAIAVDSSGNVYVTGISDAGPPTTRTDYATIKYDTNGNEMWVARYDAGINRRDEAYAIAVDSSGHVYVTGWSYAGSPTGWDYVTIKYEDLGSSVNEKWVMRYSGPVDDAMDKAKAIAVDSAGNVYVTGESDATGAGAWDYATIKYDTNGNEKWVARYDGGNGGDFVEAIALDSSGDVYVTGWSPGGATGRDYATVKYEDLGSSVNEEWVMRYNGAGNGNDTAKAIAIYNDSLSGMDYVYVTGESYEGSAWALFDCRIALVGGSCRRGLSGRTCS